MKWAALTLPMWLALATCTHRAKDVAYPDVAARLEVSSAAAPVVADSAVVAIGERGAYVLRASGEFTGTFPGAPRADLNERNAQLRWVDAVEIRALEGAGRWTLGLDSAGTIHRLRGAGGLEPMNARLGLPAAVRRIAARGAAAGLVALDDHAAFVVERERVLRLEGAAREVAASGNALVLAREHGVDVVDLEGHRTRSFVLEAPRAVALTESGVVVVATDGGLYRENGSGELTLRYEADATMAPTLAVEGERVWFGDGGRLGVLDERGVALSGELADKSIDRIAAGPAALWIVAGGVARAIVRPGDVWPAEVERVVKSTCVPCHDAGGAGAFLLTTPQAFRAHRDDVERALASGAMPPRTQPLAPADRARLLEWVRANR